MAVPTTTAAADVQVQQNGIAPSVRSPSTTSAARSPSDMNNGLERRASATYAHFRQASRAQGLYQHSRNTSYVNSPATSPLSPQLSGITSHAGAMPEMSGLSIIHPTALERRLNESLSNTLSNSVNNNSSTSTLGSEREVGDVNNAKLAQVRSDRRNSVKGRRAHAHHRSQSKQQQQQQQQHSLEQKTVSEYALHHLFNSVSH